MRLLPGQSPNQTTKTGCPPGRMANGVGRLQALATTTAIRCAGLRSCIIHAPPPAPTPPACAQAVPRVPKPQVVEKFVWEPSDGSGGLKVGFLCARACMRACMCACDRACMRACVRACRGSSPSHN